MAIPAGGGSSTSMHYLRCFDPPKSVERDASRQPGDESPPCKMSDASLGGKGKGREDYSPPSGNPKRGWADSLGWKRVRICRNRSEISRREAEIGRKGSESSPNCFEIVWRGADFAGVASELTGGDRSGLELAQNRIGFPTIFRSLRCELGSRHAVPRYSDLEAPAFAPAPAGDVFLPLPPPSSRSSPTRFSLAVCARGRLPLSQARAGGGERSRSCRRCRSQGRSSPRTEGWAASHSGRRWGRAGRGGCRRRTKEGVRGGELVPQRGEGGQVSSAASFQERSSRGRGSQRRKRRAFEVGAEDRGRERQANVRLRKRFKPIPPRFGFDRPILSRPRSAPTYAASAAGARALLPQGCERRRKGSPGG